MQSTNRRLHKTSVKNPVITAGRNSNAKVGWALLIEIAKSFPGTAKLIATCYLVFLLHTQLPRKDGRDRDQGTVNYAVQPTRNSRMQSRDTLESRPPMSEAGLSTIATSELRNT